jgi:hypothetical protein
MHHYRPINIGRHLVYIPGETEVEEEVKHAAAQDWLDFLSARAAEMKKGDGYVYVYITYTTISNIYLFCQGIWLIACKINKWFIYKKCTIIQ